MKGITMNYGYQKSFLFCISIILYLSLTNYTQAQTGWFSQTSGTPFINLNSVYFVNTSTGWAVGDGGTIIKTINGGYNWVPQDIGGFYNLKDIHFVSPLIGWVVGGINPGNGFILKTTNGGNNWNIQLDSANSILSIYFPNSTTGFAVGEDVHRTTNGGISWSFQPTFGNFYSVFFPTPSIGFAVGNDQYYGYIIKTINGGNTWSGISGGHNIYGVHFSTSIGWAAGDVGTIKKTINGGTSWQSLNSGVNNHLYSIFFTSDSSGFVVGTGGTIRRTRTSGSSWYSQVSGTQVKLSTVHFPATNTGWVVGDGGRILKTTTGGDVLPDTTTLLSPPDSSLGVPLTPVLKWNGLANADRYRIQISTSNSFNTTVFDDSVQMVTQLNVPSGILDSSNLYYWRVNAINVAGTGPWSAIWCFTTTPTGIKKISSIIPNRYNLSQNFPNPFNPFTKIKFDIPKSSLLEITVYDILGNEITTLVNEKLSAGSYMVDWDASGYTSGMYFYRLDAGEFVETKKMLMIK